MMSAFFIFVARYFFVVPVVILGAYFLTRPRAEWKRLALFAVPAGVLTYVLGFIGSHLYFDPRPFVVGHFTPLISHAPDNGFPSDHTLLASAFAAVGMFWRRWLAVVLWLLAILIAVSRVYVGVHHPIDVIGSMVFALVATGLWWTFLTRFYRS